MRVALMRFAIPLSFYALFFKQNLFTDSHDIQVFVLALKRTGHIPTALNRVFNATFLFRLLGYKKLV